MPVMAMAGDNDPKPPVINYILSFVLVGIAWGLTTPFIRRAARAHHPAPHPVLQRPSVKNHWLRSRLYGAFFSVLDLLRNPRYAVPLLLNLTGSVWFFLLIGQAGMSSLPSLLPTSLCASLAPKQKGHMPTLHMTELSLTVPIVNTMAFLFTVLGEWYVEGKVISRGKTDRTSWVLTQPSSNPFPRSIDKLIVTRYNCGHDIFSCWHCIVCTEQVLISPA